jgi:phosphate acetyltransferase
MMTNCLYIAVTEPYSGKSLVSLGMTELLLRRTSRVGIFRPVVSRRSAAERDKNIDLLLTHFGLDLGYDDTFAFSRREAADLIAHGRFDDLLDRVIEKYKALEERSDFMLCIGSDFEGVGATLEFDLNAEVAKNLGCPVLIVSSGVERDIEEVVNLVRATIDAYEERGCQVFGVIVNRADPDNVFDIRLALQEELQSEELVLSVIPENRALSSPTMEEIAERLDAEILYGGDHLARLAQHYLVIAMHVDHYLSYLKEDALLITPGDRSDVILSAMQAHESRNYPQIAGIVLSGGLRPRDTVKRLLDGAPIRVPILLAEPDTYRTAACISNVRSYITAGNRQKINISLELFEEFVDTLELERQIGAIQPRGITPKMFIYHLIQKAKSDKRHIVLPEGEDERILKATEVLLNRDIVDLTLIGDPKRIPMLIKRLGLQIDLDCLPILQPMEWPKFDEYVETLVELRCHKGMTADMAQDLMCDVSYFGTMMVYKGDADGMVSGAAHTTMHTIRPALQFVKTKPGFSVVSSVFFMALPDKVLVYGDCAVNPNPTAEQLAEIAISSADTARDFGIEPRVAMLSYSSGESGVGEDVERVRAATRLARERRPDLQLEGPIQYDAAVDASVAAQKMPGSEIAGRATVFIFPDLNTGNNTYKAVQRETGAIAIGPVLQGLNKPVNDLSRGCTVDDIINTVAITAIQAQIANSK